MNSILKRLIIAAIFYPGLSAFAHANMTVIFDEGAPKDRFTFTNTGSCTITDAKIALDLSSSKSGLIFDVTGNGPGVEVFQPLEMVSGADALLSIPEVKDGDNQITLNIGKLNAGQSIAFTIDVDDTMGGSEIIVSNSEIQSAKVDFSQNNKTTSAVFTADAGTKIPLEACKIL